MKKKYKEGDIIVVKDSFYLCEISGKHAAMFKEIKINYYGYCTTHSKPFYLSSTIKDTSKPTDTEFNSLSRVSLKIIMEKISSCGT